MVSGIEPILFKITNLVMVEDEEDDVEVGVMVLTEDFEVQVPITLQCKFPPSFST